VELRSNATPGDIDAVIQATYQQVLGNPHLLVSERLVIAENTVPYYRDFANAGLCQRSTGFLRLLQLYRGYANSDRVQLTGSKPRLVKKLARNTSSLASSPSAGAFLAAGKGDDCYSAFGGSKTFV
jgi:hypothetical protein